MVAICQLLARYAVTITRGDIDGLLAVSPDSSTAGVPVRNSPFGAAATSAGNSDSGYSSPNAL